MEDKNEEQNAKVMPLWQSALDAMRKQGIAFEAEFKTQWLEEMLCCKYETIKFGAAISAINDEIGRDGYYLSARDSSGQWFKVVKPEQADRVSDNRVRCCFRTLARAITLWNGLLANPEAKLEADLKRKIESKAQKNAVRYALMKRPMMIAKANGGAQKLLENLNV